MSDTTYVVTVSKTVKGKTKKKIQKFETEKKARVFYEKERQTLLQEGKWGDVLADSANLLCLSSPYSSPDYVGVTVELSTEVNFEYYIEGLFCAMIAGEPDKVRKIVRTLYRRGYDKGWEEGHWDS